MRLQMTPFVNPIISIFFHNVYTSNKDPPFPTNYFKAKSQAFAKYKILKYMYI